MAIQLFELSSHSSQVRLRLARGHFATGHSHVNYYVDLTMTKHRLSESRAVAQELCQHISHTTVVDTILCLDGTEVIGACMASELSKAGYTNMNAHRTIYVVTPEHTSGSQLIFRDNIAPMIVGKYVLVLAASVTTGYTVRSAMEAVRYYNGVPAGACAIFSCLDTCADFPVISIFNQQEHLPDYESHPAGACPMCAKGEKLDGIVNSFGVSALR